VSIEPRFSPDQGRQINDLPAAEVLAKDRVTFIGFFGILLLLASSPPVWWWAMPRTGDCRRGALLCLAPQ
jgi:hypothetical protein